MEKVKKVLTNKWFILVVSVLCAAYTLVLGYFAYAVFFYDIVYTDKMTFAIAYSAFSIISALFFFYTRKSFITCIIGMVNMVAFFPTLLLDWGNWPLLIPAAMVTVFGFFCCKMNDTIKTVFGTIFLLLYILGGIAFFLIMNVFRVTTVDTLLTPNGGLVSPSGYFRCYVLDVQNKSSGKVAIYVEPNQLDKNIKDVIELRTTIKRLIKQAIKENKDDALHYDVHWDGDLLMINGEEYFDEKDFLAETDAGVTYDFSEGVWTHTYFEFEYPIIELIDRFKQVITDKLSEVSAESEETSVTTTAVTE
ncbi:MAG: hypothetical protein IJC04_04845 [Oscillospiraceae bacterium]|nr:hypothetical protein [Oscillospiraceae bacterium]